MVNISSFRSMLCAGFILLAGCLAGGCTIYKKINYAGGVIPIFTIQGEYVVQFKADGDFNPWYPGAKNTPVMPAGVYEITSSNEYTLVTSNDLSALSNRKIAPLTSQDENLCETKFKGMPCSPNYVLQAFSDPFESKLWGIGSKGVKSKDIDFSTDSVKVMVLDTGVNCAHEDIVCAGTGFNAITGQEGVEAANDDNGHGTHVAGTICAVKDNAKGIRGVSAKCPIVPAKFLSASGSGALFDAIKAINWAANNGVDIINASFGGGGYSAPFQNAINEAKNKGILFIAAAGNERNNNDLTRRYPSSYDNVLSVASIDSRGSLSYFSNYGKESVDVSAPGSDIYSLDYRGGYKSLSGTSMATPHVAGLAALLYEKNKDLPKSKRYSKAFEAITTTAKSRDVVTFGDVDASKALEDESGCAAERCKNCMRKCTDRFPERCKDFRKCRKGCRNRTSCAPKCI